MPVPAPLGLAGSAKFESRSRVAIASRFLEPVHKLVGAPESANHRSGRGISARDIELRRLPQSIPQMMIPKGHAWIPRHVTYNPRRDQLERCPDQ
jgi:hypothetical protein